MAKCERGKEKEEVPITEDPYVGGNPNSFGEVLSHNFPKTTKANE
jgi:hypothetical protein